MSKQHFHTLLSRYRNGECSEREKRLVSLWFSMLDKEPDLRSDQENSEIEERLWNAIQTRQKGRKARPLFLLNRWKWIAAGILILLAGTWAAYRYDRLPAHPGGEQYIDTGARNLLKRTNLSGTDELISLPDGSEIRLSPRSSIKYPSGFEGDRREVFLTGKAFFQVVSNPDKPFLVHTGEIVTKVLGTSFWVEGVKGADAVEVSVVTGKVSVSPRTEKSEEGMGPVKGGVILTANQKVRFSNESHVFETGLVEAPVLLVPDVAAKQAEQAFVFEDTPVQDVIKALEKAYGIEIILENETLKECLFRGDITRQSLFNKLDLLCSSINATYEVRGTRVLVSGKGCSFSHANP